MNDIDVKRGVIRFVLVEKSFLHTIKNTTLQKFFSRPTNSNKIYQYDNVFCVCYRNHYYFTVDKLNFYSCLYTLKFCVSIKTHAKIFQRLTRKFGFRESYKMKYHKIPQKNVE